MPIDTHSVLAIALMVFAATLATYLLSQWSIFFGQRSALAQWGCGLGVAALLVASTLYFLSMISPTMFKLEAVQEPHASQPIRAEFPQRSAHAGEDSLDPQASSELGESIALTLTSRETIERRADLGSAVVADASLPSSRRTKTAVSRQAIARPTSVASVFGSGPWAATHCVFGVQPDPAAPDLWWLENECVAPVGILIAACSEARTNCDAPRSTSWIYAPTGMFLPAKAQRSVTFAEQTHRGIQIRFIACEITSQTVIDLLRSDEATAAKQWRESFAELARYDECVARVQSLSEAGTHAHFGIDELATGALPGRARQTRDRD